MTLLYSKCSAKFSAGSLGYQAGLFTEGYYYHLTGLLLLF